MTVYLSPSLLQDRAHADIERHTVGTPAGRCAACGEPEPCRTRNAAHAALWVAGRHLPRRRPGHAGPHWRVISAEPGALPR